MEEILTRAGCYISIILLGYVLRRTGMFIEETFKILSTIVIKITLPAALVCSFADMTIDKSLLSIIPLSFLFGFLYIGLAIITANRAGKQAQAFAIINMTGYNIGSFTLPFVQGFMGTVGVITTGLFDLLNASIGLGINYGIASVVRDGKGFSLKLIVQRLMKSVPFLCYVIVISLNLLNISIPKPVVSLAEIMGNANAFLAMLMIGVGFKLDAEKSQLVQIFNILLIRYGVAVLLALGCYHLLPFTDTVRQTLVLLVFSPVPSITPAFTSELNGDVGMASALNSMSIICSIIAIVVSLTLML